MSNLSSDRNRSTLGSRWSVLLGWRALAAIAVLPLLLAVAGCVSVIPVMHGLGMCNVGTTPITVDRLQYGQVRWPQLSSWTLRVPEPACISTFSITAEMPIPETLEVHWRTADGTPKFERVPIRSRIGSTADLQSIVVKFSGDSFTVVKRLYVRNERRDVVIYP